MTKQFQIRDKVRTLGLEGIVAGIAIDDKDRLFYIVRDGQGRSHYRDPQQLEAA